MHELCHIVHGPHHAGFYKLLDILFNEYDIALVNGFRPDGNAIGGKKVSLPEAKRLALESAEKRAYIYSVMPPGSDLFDLGGRKLGGSKIVKVMKTLILEAAEKRSMDAIWCGSGIVYDGGPNLNASRVLQNGLKDSTVIINSRNIVGAAIDDKKESKKQGY